MKKPDLSVVIPVLNEAEHLPKILNDIKKQKEIQIEIIIGDGGSTDGSEEVAKQHNVVWVRTDKGRGRQMNAAAAKAKGEFILFLHADSAIDDPYLFLNAVSALQS